MIHAVRAETNCARRITRLPDHAPAGSRACRITRLPDHAPAGSRARRITRPPDHAPAGSQSGGCTPLALALHTQVGGAIGPVDQPAAGAGHLAQTALLLGARPQLRRQRRESVFAARTRY